MTSIDNLLMNIGIYPNKNGYRYIKTYVDMETDASYMDLYDMVAKKCNTTSKTVYGSIRRAILSADAVGKLKNIDNYFDASIYDENHVLTNSEFLSLLGLLFSNTDTEEKSKVTDDGQ